MRRLALLALVLPLAACGGGSKSSSGGSAAANVESAAANTLAAGSEHVTVFARAEVGGQQIAVTGSGAFDTKERLGSVKGALNAASVSTEIDEVTQGTVVYLSSPLVAAVLPTGKSWLRIDISKVAALGVLAQQDPSQALSFLDSLKDVKKVGTERIDGVFTTHYRGTLSSGTYDVWTGDDGYVHRIEVVSSGSTKVTATSTLSQFGAAVHVIVPPASKSFTTTKIPGLGG